MSQIFAINSGNTIYKYQGTLGLPGASGNTNIPFGGYKVVNIASIQSIYSGTMSNSGVGARQNFG